MKKPPTSAPAVPVIVHAAAADTLRALLTDALDLDDPAADDGAILDAIDRLASARDLAQQAIEAAAALNGAFAHRDHAIKSARQAAALARDPASVGWDEVDPYYLADAVRELRQARDEARQERDEARQERDEAQARADALAEADAQIDQLLDLAQLTRHEWDLDRGRLF